MPYIHLEMKVNKWNTKQEIKQIQFEYIFRLLYLQIHRIGIWILRDLTIVETSLKNFNLVRFQSYGLVSTYVSTCCPLGYWLVFKSFWHINWSSTEEQMWLVCMWWCMFAFVCNQWQHCNIWSYLAWLIILRHDMYFCQLIKHNCLRYRPAVLFRFFYCCCFFAFEISVILHW